jgi:hypothetical protein
MAPALWGLVSFGEAKSDSAGAGVSEEVSAH